MSVSAAGARVLPPQGDREGELRRQLTALVSDAQDLLEVDLDWQPGELFDTERALAVIAAVALTVSERLRELEHRNEHATALVELGLRGAELDGRLRVRELQRRTGALAGVEAALTRLRNMPTPGDLVDDLCPALVRGCGFWRIMLSRVNGQTWHPWKAEFRHREIRDSDREWMESGSIPMSEMVLERELIQTGRAGIIADAVNDPRAAQKFVEQTGTRSYVVAPIMPGGQVIGLIHADYFPTDRVVDAVDAHILGQFADGFGRLYERAVLRERLERERDHVRDTLRKTETIMDNLARAEVELVRQVDQRAAAGTASALAMVPGAAGVDEALTAREREVMALLVTGQTNSAIAERLVISEGTVKSHVKQILRKLGAVNRSEVIARYLGVVSDQ